MQQEHECEDFEYFCNSLKRCCKVCGKWFEFNDSSKKWVKA